MSAPFAKAMARYKAEDVSGAIAALDPLLRSGKLLPFEVLLLAAQCFTKAEQWREAATYYNRAADLQTANAPMLRGLAAGLMVRVDDDYAMLDRARQAARSGVFNQEVENYYRFLLHEHVCINEAR